MREAASKGHPIGIVNDGNVGEPGTGAFLAEVGNRGDWNEIALQMLTGRPGVDDTPPHVTLGGGERNFLPTDVEGVHYPAGRGDGQEGRQDGRNLIEEAEADGYVVIRTREEFEALQAELDRRPRYAPKVLGLFACHHTFNDRNEEALIAGGFVDPSTPEDSQTGDIVLYGQPPSGDPDGVNPPLAGEMTRMALQILERVEEKERKPFLLVAEPESTDNFANANNAIGEVHALREANRMIEVAREHVAAHPDTLVLTAADGDASGMSILPATIGEPVGAPSVNPAEGLPVVENPLDGLRGRGTTAFVAAPDQFGNSLGFAWAGSAPTSRAASSRARRA
jgi:alkaline phosphatase